MLKCYRLSSAKAISLGSVSLQDDIPSALRAWTVLASSPCLKDGKLASDGCIFTCLSSRAAHLDMLHSLDADAHFHAITQFVADRGVPEKIVSDSGSSTVLSDKELLAVSNSWEATSRVDTELQRKGIEWTLLPPSASHMIGVWDKILSVRKILTPSSVRSAPMTTLFCDVEDTLHSRPRALDASSYPSDMCLCTGNPGRDPRRRLLPAAVEACPTLDGRVLAPWSRTFFHTLRMRHRHLSCSPNASVGALTFLVE